MISIPVGTIIDGAYRVFAPRLSMSHHADAYCGEPLQPGPPVLIIFLRERLPASGPARDAFEREGRALSRFTHANITEVYDFGVLQNTPYLIIAEPSGEPLASSRLAPERAVRAIASLYDAISGAHEAGLAHGSLSASSLVLAPDGRLILWDLALVRLRRALASAPQAEEAADLAQVAGIARTLLLAHEAPKAPAPPITPTKPITPNAQVAHVAPNAHVAQVAHVAPNAQVAHAAQVAPVAPNAQVAHVAHAAQVAQVAQLAHVAPNAQVAHVPHVAQAAPARHLAPPPPPPPTPASLPQASQAIAKAHRAAAVARPAQFARIAPPTPRPPQANAPLASSAIEPRAPAKRIRKPIDREPSLITPLEPPYKRWLKNLLKRDAATMTALYDTGVHSIADTARKRSINLAVTCAIALFVIVLLMRA